MRQQLYNLAALLLPRPHQKKFNDVYFQSGFEKPDSFSQQLLKIFYKHRVYGSSFALFNQDGITWHATYGQADNVNKVTAGTFFRVASVSKMVTAACVMRLHQQGLLDIDADIRSYLPLGETINRPITLRGMMTHTAGFHDGQSYHQLIGTNALSCELMSRENTQPDIISPTWEYSNFGAGLIAIVLEGILGESFETLMQKYLFKPLHIKASFYPQHIMGCLADAYRMLPFSSVPRFNATQRQTRPDTGWDEVHTQTHHALAQGNCCMDMSGLVTIAQTLMVPGYLNKDTLEEMQREQASFGERDKRLRQGIGLFILKDTTFAPHALYGHQGLAYGAVHGVFFDTYRKDGFAFMTSGASLAKYGVLTEVNVDLIKLWQANA